MAVTVNGSNFKMAGTLIATNNTVNPKIRTAVKNTNSYDYYMLLHKWTISQPRCI